MNNPISILHKARLSQWINILFIELGGISTQRNDRDLHISNLFKKYNPKRFRNTTQETETAIKITEFETLLSIHISAFKLKLSYALWYPSLDARKRSTIIQPMKEEEEEGEEKKNKDRNTGRDDDNNNLDTATWKSNLAHYSSEASDLPSSLQAKL